MRAARWLLLALLPGNAVFADAAVPDPPCPAEDLCALPPSGPLALELQFSLSREHSCSQSWESTSDFGALRIRVDERDGAAMSLESTHSNVFGSKRSRGKIGAAPVRSRSDSKLEWTGRATRAAGLLRLSMKPRTKSPVERDRMPSLDLECRLARLPVTRFAKKPGGDDLQSIEETARVLLCKSSEPLLEGLHPLVEKASGVPLGRTGFGLSLRDMMFNHGGLQRYQSPGSRASE